MKKEIIRSAIPEMWRADAGISRATSKMLEAKAELFEANAKAAQARGKVWPSAAREWTLNSDNWLSLAKKEREKKECCYKQTQRMEKRAKEEEGESYGEK